MKKLLVIALSLISLNAFAVDRPELTLRQKLVLAEAATALVTGPIILPVAIVTGNKEALCHALEPKLPGIPSSYNPNPDGVDQCPRGNWLRIIPYITNYIKD